MSTYNIISSSDESTVVSEYKPVGNSSGAYQSEAALEAEEAANGIADAE